jgi:hypothetical protein
VFEIVHVGGRGEVGDSGAEGAEDVREGREVIVDVGRAALEEVELLLGLIVELCTGAAKGILELR